MNSVYQALSWEGAGFKARPKGYLHSVDWSAGLEYYTGVESLEWSTGVHNEK